MGYIVYEMRVVISKYVVSIYSVWKNIREKKIMKT